MPHLQKFLLFHKYASKPENLLKNIQKYHLSPLIDNSLKFRSREKTSGKIWAIQFSVFQFEILVYEQKWPLKVDKLQQQIIICDRYNF